MPEPKQNAASFKDVLAKELDLLEKLRAAPPKSTAPKKPQTIYVRAYAAQLAGLAFSGGGIRSATFNLGVIQALARKGLLSKFDYLSTVSGGGFIGAWLSALLHRPVGKTSIATVDERRVKDVEPTLKTHPVDSGFPKPDDTVGFPAVENAAVRFLRRYSNYLTPRLGLSGDLPAALSIFLRNFVLLQFSLVTLVAGFLLTAHVTAAWSAQFKYGAPWPLGWLAWLGALIGWEWPFVGGVLMLILSLWFTGRLLVRRDLGWKRPGGAGRTVFLKVVVPNTLAAWWLVAGFASWPNDLSLSGHGVYRDMANWINNAWGAPINPTLLDGFFWALSAMLGYIAAWGLGYIAARFRRKDDATDATEPTVRGGFWAPVTTAAVAGVILGLLLFAATRYVEYLHQQGALDMWHAVGFGTPMFLLGLSLVITVHIGVARRQFSEHDREWWARLGGLILLTTGAWTLTFVIVLYAPPLVHWLAGGGLVAVVTWAAGSGAGAWIARSPVTGDAEGGKNWREAVTLLAPWLFIGGLTVITADAIHVALLASIADRPAWGNTSDLPNTVRSALSDLEYLPFTGIVYAWLGAWIMCALVCLRLDINLFSMHALYRNRLTRAYLGASHTVNRHPNPFTGFDRDDDLSFHKLCQQRPIPIINTSINMTGGDDLAWQTRRSASFAFTPCWAGFEAKSTQGQDLGAYRPTAEYAGGLSLGTLVAISGAAASPNMGYHTSAPVAALLTAFNFRLGRWCGNPKHEHAWRRSSPGFAARPILAELTGSATAQAAWINLTDGGHFENLAIYELVRRRCRFIVITDAGCDPEYQFEDLANAIRKCWTDFGVDIRFENLNPLHPKNNTRYCERLHAVGRIRYPDFPDGQYDGVIIYLKSALTGNEWPDIRQYADVHTDFPHESTTDQFFDEDQFEAYRHLGYHIATQVVEELFGKGDVATKTIAEMTEKLAPNKTPPVKSGE